MIEKLNYTLDEEHNERAEHFAMLSDKINELIEAHNALEKRVYTIWFKCNDQS